MDINFIDRNFMELEFFSQLTLKPGCSNVSQLILPDKGKGSWKFAMLHDRVIYISSAIFWKFCMTSYESWISREILLWKYTLKDNLKKDEKI